MAHKFSVGDIIIGNVMANRYGITCEGYVGIVISVDRDDWDWSCGGLHTTGSDGDDMDYLWEDGLNYEDPIIISGYDEDRGVTNGDEFCVSASCFDLIRNAFCPTISPDVESLSNVDDFIGSF